MARFGDQYEPEFRNLLMELREVRVDLRKLHDDVAVMAGVLDRMERTMNQNEQALVTAAQALTAEVDTVAQEYQASLTKISDLTAQLAAKTSGDDTPDEVAQINAEVAAMNARTESLRNLATPVNTAAQNSQGSGTATDATASGAGANVGNTAAAVPLSGVPLTPVSTADAGTTGPAVPSTDHVGVGPNGDTSGAPLSGATTTDSTALDAAAAAAPAPAGEVTGQPGVPGVSPDGEQVMPAGGEAPATEK